MVKFMNKPITIIYEEFTISVNSALSIKPITIVKIKDNLIKKYKYNKKMFISTIVLIIVVLCYCGYLFSSYKIFSCVNVSLPYVIII